MRDTDTFCLSGSECALALHRLGLEIVRQADGWTVLRRGTRLVVVPDVLVISGPVLDAILERADLSLVAMLDALDEIPTQPDLCTV